MVTFSEVTKVYYYELSDEERNLKQLIFQSNKLILSLYRDELKEQGYLNEDQFDVFEEEFTFEDTFNKF